MPEPKSAKSKITKDTPFTKLLSQGGVPFVLHPAAAMDAELSKQAGMKRLLTIWECQGTHGPIAAIVPVTQEFAPAGIAAALGVAEAEVTIPAAPTDWAAPSPDQEVLIDAAVMGTTSVFVGSGLPNVVVELTAINLMNSVSARVAPLSV